MAWRWALVAISLAAMTVAAGDWAWRGRETSRFHKHVPAEAGAGRTTMLAVGAGCGAAAFRMQASALEAVEARGAQALNRPGAPRWRPTPVDWTKLSPRARSRYENALRCASPPADWAGRLDAAADTPGGYYAEPERGVTVLALPREGVTAVVYFN